MPLRAVIVDDSTEFLLTARSLLERAGMTVVASASTGAEALRRIVAHDPDVVILDVGLGDESGFDVAERLNSATDGRCRVILISAHHEQDLRDLIDASPAIGFMPKSRFSAQAIIELLDGRPDGARPD
jgi:DNA-binding NarL/FixJ family response regulator